jgi:hypothetical protein
MTSSANINPPIEGSQKKQEDAKAKAQEDFHIPHWLVWAISRTKKQPTFLGHIALTLCLAVFVLGGYCALFWFAGTKEAEWLGTGNPLELEAIQANVEQLSATPAEQTRLISQFQEIETRAARHARIMGFFYKQYYISLSMIVAAAVVASICLFFISKSGWEQANNAVINIFIFASAIILFYGNLTFVFKQDENLKGNQELYLSYIALREEVMSYWATQRISMSEEPLEVTQFILYLDNKLQTLNRIELGFSSPQISTFIDQLKFDESGNSLLLQPSQPQ